MCFFNNIGYVVLMNTDILAAGTVATPYATLIDAFVPYLADVKPKVQAACNYNNYPICIFSNCNCTKCIHITQNLK